jgi:integrase
LARTTRPLTNTEVDRARAREREYSLVDGQGLKLRITPAGTRTWLFNYQRPADGKRTNIGFGQYPDVSLAQARRQREQARGLLAQGIDPRQERERQARRARQASSQTFELVAAEWLEVKRSQVSADHADDIWNSLRLHAFPVLGPVPVSEINAPDAIAALRPLAAQNKLEMLQRVIHRLREIMTFAVNSGMVHSNPLSGIGKAFPSPKPGHFRALKPEQLPELMRVLSTANMKRTTRVMIEYQLHCMTRPSETAGARWSEIDLAANQWVIPAERMKSKRQHTVPLSMQSLALLELMRPISGSREYVFCSDRDPRRHTNPSSANMALKRAGAGTTAHGLRALASTTLNESGGFHPDIIESALAHRIGDEVRQAYNRAEYLARRSVMMQWWSDHIEAAAMGNMSMVADVANVHPIGNAESGDDRGVKPSRAASSSAS